MIATLSAREDPTNQMSLEGALAAPIGTASVALATSIWDDQAPIGPERLRVVDATGRETHATTVSGCGLKDLPGTGLVATLQLEPVQAASSPAPSPQQSSYTARVLVFDESLRVVRSIDLGTHPGVAVCVVRGSSSMGHDPGDHPLSLNPSDVTATGSSPAGDPGGQADTWALGDASSDGHWVGVGANVHGRPRGFLAKFASGVAVAVPGVPRYVLGNSLVQACGSGLNLCASTESRPQGVVLHDDRSPERDAKGVCWTECSWFNSGNSDGTAILETTKPSHANPHLLDEAYMLVDPVTGRVLHDYGVLPAVVRTAVHEPRSGITVLGSMEGVFAFDATGRRLWRRGSDNMLLCGTVGTQMAVLDARRLHLVAASGRDAASIPWDRGTPPSLTCPAIVSTGFLLSQSIGKPLRIYRLRA